MSNHRIKKICRIIFLNILLVFILVIFIEGMARLFFYFTRGCSTVGLPERRQYLYYQPFVMFGPDWDEELVYSKYTKVGYHMDTYRILLIGGSTAAHFPESLLKDAFHKKFPHRKFKIINAASGGYNSRQELIVTAIWGPNLDVDMIISLDGANDLTHRLRMKRAGTFYLNQAYELALKRPFLSPFVHLLRHSQFIHGITRLKARLEIGSIEHYMDIIPIYIAAQHSINLLAKGMSATRIIVLQPFMGFKEPLSEAEAKFTHYQYRESVIKRMYSLLHQELMVLAKKDSVLYVDGRYAFNGMKKTIFSDDIHFVNDEGYRILAEYIVSFVAEKNLQ